MYFLKDKFLKHMKEVDTISLILFVLVAYIFNIGVRYIYVNSLGEAPQFVWNHAMMINTNDGYYWLEGARDILKGESYTGQSPIHSFIANLIVFFVKLFPFIPFDTLVFYLSGFLSSTIVIPIIFIGRILKMPYMGFLSALLAGMAWSYYHRTMFGYLDTDMLMLVFPLFAILFLMLGFQKRSIVFFGFAALIEVFMVSWHHGLLNINHALFLLSMFYLLWKKEQNSKVLFIGILFLVPLIDFSLTVKIFLILSIVLTYRFTMSTQIVISFSDKIQNNKEFYYALVGSFFLLYLVTKGGSFIFHFINNVYVDRDAANDVLNFHYYSVLNTVREAGHISYDTIVHRISGSWIGFIFGFIGYLLLIRKSSLMIFLLPLLALGAFTLQGGLRFTIFAIPVFALGNGYISYLIGTMIADKLKKQQVMYGASLFIMALFIYPNYQHIYKYLVPSVFINNEVAVLDSLKNDVKKGDYAVAWWDYGYPIRYYAHLKTLIDGGKHSGAANFPVSYILTKDPISAVNMARLAVEYSKKGYPIGLVQELKDYNYKDPNSFFTSLKSKDFPLPKKTSDIYFILPNRMLDILSTVAIFSNVDLKNGKPQRSPFFYQAKHFNETQQTLELGSGIRMIKKSMTLQIGKNFVPIHKFTVVMYDQKGHLHRDEKIIHPTSNINVIYMPNYNRILVLEDKLYNSIYIQLYVLENYDKNLFEPVNLNPLIKVFRIKK